MPRKQTTPVDQISDSAESPAIASFETQFEHLTAIVDRLEAGNVPLGEMLKLYEEGMGLASNLKTVLTEAELRVEKLAAMHEERAQAEPSGFDGLSDEPQGPGEDDELLF